MAHLTPPIECKDVRAGVRRTKRNKKDAFEPPPPYQSRRSGHHPISRGVHARGAQSPGLVSVLETVQGQRTTARCDAGIEQSFRGGVGGGDDGAGNGGVDDAGDG